MSDERLRETRRSGRTVYTGRVVRLDVDDVELADGTAAVREAVRHPGAVVIVPLTTDDRVVLVRQFRYVPGMVLTELPAGTLKPGEAPETCARRELAEETGHAAGRLEHAASFYSAPGFCDEIVHCFIASDLTAAEAGEPDEDERIEIEVVPFAEAIERVRAGRIRDAKTVAGLLLVADRRNR